jgi:hypothetical protein
MVGRKANISNVLGASAAVIAMVTGAVTQYAIWFIAAPFVFFAIRRIVLSPPERAAFKQRAADARQKWEAADKEWQRRAGGEPFTAVKARLVAGKASYERLISKRIGLLDALRRDVRNVQLTRYLDAFEIEEAKITGVGPSKKQTLEAYGIETALDVEYNKVLRVPGFGPKTATNVVAWRRSIEGRFVFDPKRGVDQRDIDKVESGIAAERLALQIAMLKDFQELQSLPAQIAYARKQLLPAMTQLLTVLTQAEADMRAAGAA